MLDHSSCDPWPGMVYAISSVSDPHRLERRWLAALFKRSLPTHCCYSEMQEAGRLPRLSRSGRYFSPAQYGDPLAERREFSVYPAQRNVVVVFTAIGIRDPSRAAHTADVFCVCQSVPTMGRLRGVAHTDTPPHQYFAPSVCWYEAAETAQFPALSRRLARQRVRSQKIRLEISSPRKSAMGRMEDVRGCSRLRSGSPNAR